VLLIIPTHNNFTYTKNTIDRFQNLVDDIMVMDNASTYGPMVDYLDSIDGDVEVKRYETNEGPRRFYNDKWFYWDLPYHFLVTDPDLEFDDRLDRQALDHLFELTEELGAYKMGSALSVDMGDESTIDDALLWSGKARTVREIETGYYSDPISTKTMYGDRIYTAAIDTTFAAYNRLHETGFMDVNYRVDGRYTARHLGWLKNPPIPKEEADYYTMITESNQFSSTETTRRGRNYDY